MTAKHSPSAAPGTPAEPVLHDKPVPLRMTASERERHCRYASQESRSASNFALKLYRMGMQQYEQQLTQPRPTAPAAESITPPSSTRGAAAPATRSQPCA
ncbi:Uncharacterised protein [Delftia tsuruhatensis]|uniref:hypothetical protein n=1 Tax=Delftia tsuruhatensis TaxID=180282 RepID=UPI001E74E6F0|nr:hypothetical protein [Delftia tsuruhatensis]CAB5719420.1 Uncharacterised protein [Delftia tsuruhatensis]CAC9687899.1 Uncharacterised protein [Delftia tsuruhatensis]